MHSWVAAALVLAALAVAPAAAGAQEASFAVTSLEAAEAAKEVRIPVVLSAPAAGP